MFHDFFTCTENTQEAIPELQFLHVQPGVYNNGLLTVFDHRTSQEITKTWDWFLSSNLIPIASNAFGNLFFLDVNNQHIFCFCPHNMILEFISHDLKAFFHDFLTNQDCIQQILNEKLFNETMLKLRKLKYDEIFTRIFFMNDDIIQLNTYFGTISIIQFQRLVSEFNIKNLSMNSL